MEVGAEMTIEKWRPAKAGDYGLMARFRNAETANWKFGAITRMVFHENGKALFETSSGWFLHCEVLVAYIEDADVEALASTAADDLMDYTQENWAERIEFAKELIRKHFERGEESEWIAY